MLTAYFDDTGTHKGGKWGPSKVVAIAGIFGTEGNLRGLKSEWRKHLGRPLDGCKPALKRFHMFDCQSSIGEFEGWSRTETDYLCHQLGAAIVDSGVNGYGMACSRKDWEELVTGDVLAIVGDPEGLCLRNCILKTSEWVQNNTFDPELTFVFDDFDDRPERRREARVVFDVFQRQVMPPPRLVDCLFTNSRKEFLLQVADYVAWEFYQHAKSILESERLRPPQRLRWNHMGVAMKFYGQIARREAIQKIVDHVLKHPRVDAISNHFRAYDPAAPEPFPGYREQLAPTHVGERPDRSRAKVENAKPGRKGKKSRSPAVTDARAFCARNFSSAESKLPNIARNDAKRLRRASRSTSTLDQSKRRSKMP